MSRAYLRLALFAVPPLYERRPQRPMSHSYVRSAFLLAALLLAAASARTQVATGTLPFGSFSGGPDIVNNANLNVHRSIPVRVKAGRGMPFYYILTSDSWVWYPSGGV